MKTGNRSVDLTGKVAVVTGSSRGLGKAIALGLARQGADIIVAARSETENLKLPGTIHSTAEEIQSMGRKSIPIKCDIANEQDLDNLVQKTMGELGRIDILVNNAGVAFYYPLIETPLKRWELVLRVNLIGPFLASKAVLPTMIEQGRGSIINISSLAADERSESFTGLAYGVSKAGLDRFTVGLAAEVGRHNVAVNALKPHQIVDTEGMRFWLPDADKSQWISAEGMVKAAVHLAAQDAKGITGMVATDEEFCKWHDL
ncbi:MAG: SDR family NAD(P)-dependent oxidoreductase [Thermodesulfobacteriota bacterium]|nr:SDR family NAD(P)-dependent oxidoreductase [Thermodesulfobacteriota bacterium]